MAPYPCRAPPPPRARLRARRAAGTRQRSSRSLQAQNPSLCIHNPWKPGLPTTGRSSIMHGPRIWSVNTLVAEPPGLG